MCVCVCVCVCVCACVHACIMLACMRASIMQKKAFLGFSIYTVFDQFSWMIANDIL